ncbi:MAG: hypothetical protein KGR26_10215, partial [Cyanobacteria bacterium REEB65]|nr:hypothetical protein [Cyanobacteria bacterium REEB65]
MADISTNSVMSATVWGMNGPFGGGMGQQPQRAGGDDYGIKIIDRRHPEWRQNQIRCRWLLDSYEGGEAYRQNIYGWDLTGLPIFNLVRHKREYPQPYEQNYYGLLGRPPGSSQLAQATNSDFEYRRARTPIPMFVRRAIDTWISKIYRQEIHREVPEVVEKWFANVDGSNTKLENWLKETFGPLLLSLGQLDLIFDHPRAPSGEVIASKADTLRLGLDRVVVSYILPENMVWWSLNDDGTYKECLVCEPQEQGGPAYRYWTPEDWTLFTFQGKVWEGPIKHPYGRPPIVRLFDRRRPRAKNVGLPRIEELAEIQLDYYNVDSERALSDSLHAHPLLQGPEDFIKADQSIPVGPSWLLPKIKSVMNGNPHYEGFEVVDFPSTGSESLRANKTDLVERADRAAKLTRPAGAGHADGKTVALSGISKRLDAHDGNEYLAEIASILERAEYQIVEMFLLVDGDGQFDAGLMNKVNVRYPRDFDLFSPDELTNLITDWQSALAGAGDVPAADVEMLRRLIRLIVKGLSDAEYEQIDKQIEQRVAAAAKLKGMEAEANAAQLAATAAMIPGENIPGTQSE